MKNKRPTHSAKSKSVSRTLDNLIELSHHILVCANQSRPQVDFLIELFNLLITFTHCDQVECWLKERRLCSRWVGSKKPKRFFRLGNIPYQQFDGVLEKGLSRSASKSPDETSLESDEFCAQLRMPLVIGKEAIGILFIKSLRNDFFSKEDIHSYQQMAQTVAIAVSHHRVQLAQRERVKELTCLYEIAQAAALPQQGVDSMFEEILDSLARAWQYPEVSVASILLDGSHYQSRRYQKPIHCQTADIVVGNETRGLVEVGYTQERPEADEGPFLFEERNLIDTVARELSMIIQRKTSVAENLKLQEQLRHADRLATIGQLAAGVAHELNEPLGSILGFSQLAKKQARVPEQVLDDLAKIETASLYTREIIRKLMLFARQTPPSMKRVNFNKVIQEGLFLLASRCDKAGIDLVKQLEPNLPDVNADPAQLYQVLVNLVVNSIQAITQGGVIRIETKSDTKQVYLLVIDTGCGMTEEVVKQIFVPFFTTKTSNEGTGLGLPVVHGIVTSHGGNIHVESRPGVGSQVTIQLPVLDESCAKGHLLYEKP